MPAPAPSDGEERAVIALGANLGNPAATLGQVLERLSALSTRPILRSSFWNTSPVDCPPGSPVFVNAAAAIVPQLTPDPGEIVLRKTLPNAFAATDLHDLIKSTGKSEIIFAGFMTHMCVSASARAALDLGYRSTVVATATATRDLPDPLGGTIPASVAHRTALSELADRFAIVVKDTAALLPQQATA